MCHKMSRACSRADRPSEERAGSRGNHPGAIVNGRRMEEGRWKEEKSRDSKGPKGWAVSLPSLPYAPCISRRPAPVSTVFGRIALISAGSRDLLLSSFANLVFLPSFVLFKLVLTSIGILRSESISFDQWVPCHCSPS